MAARLFRTGILATALAFGLAFAGCESDDNAGRIVTDVRATPIQGENSYNDSVHITWNAASSASHYEITYRTNMDSLDTRMAVSSYITDTVYTHSWYVKDRGALTYYVRAHGTKKNSDGTSTSWIGPWAMSSEVEVRQ